MQNFLGGGNENLKAKTCILVLFHGRDGSTQSNNDEHVGLSVR